MLITVSFVGIFILLLKPIFNICACFLSFIYFRFVSEKINDITPSIPLTTGNNESINTVKFKNGKSLYRNKVRNLIGRSVNGLVFFSIMQTGKIPFHFIRNIVYRYFYNIHMAKNVIIYGGAEIRSPNKLFIGKGSIIGHYSILDARNVIEIGENVNFSHGVWLWTEQHNHNNLDFSCESPKKKKIRICDRVWLGPRVIVLPGCTIGEGAVVGAGAVVTKDIEPFSINVGIPAKKIGERNRNINYEFNGNPLPFI
jgi:acetyltransferase-like isoleucine patch superfamily enzyme